MGDAEDDSFFGASQASSEPKEIRNFHYVTYTKDKRVESTVWVPGQTQLLALSCYDAATKIENQTRARTSHVLFWSFQDSLAPHLCLTSPQDVSVFQFYPSNVHYIVGGLSSGQMIVWRLSPKDYRLNKQKETGEGEGIDPDLDEGGSKVPTVAHRITSNLDESHRKPVQAICWLPPQINITGKKGAT